ncbi:MAG TPA: nuclear transport factor 2 family protein, partial [Vicinamibacterales bacterium]|nr:nuclear transport factor 2 family protein [Vicinamibacterales bacterium]
MAALLAAGTVAALSGQHGDARKPMALTPMDYVEIRQLVARYAFAVDTGNNNGYDYADLFSADGEFMRPYARGREQL